MDKRQDSSQEAPANEPVQHAKKQPYEAPQVQSVKLTDEAAESLT